MAKRIVIMALVCCALATTAHATTKKATVSNSGSEWTVEIWEYWFGGEKGIHRLKKAIVLNPGSHHVLAAKAPGSICLSVRASNKKDSRAILSLHGFCTESWEDIDFFDGLFESWSRNQVIYNRFQCCPIEKKLWVENSTSWNMTVRIMEGYNVDTSAPLLREVQIEAQHEKNRGWDDHYVFFPPSAAWAVEIVFRKEGRKDISHLFRGSPRVIVFSSDDLVERDYWTFWRKVTPK